MNHLNGFEIYNLGESKTVTLNQLIEILERKTGKKAIRENLSEQPGDVNTTFADISKARARLGYYPKYDIEFGIDKFLNWYYKYKNLHQ
jgi:UDP-glucuronate 4-epimerase